MKPEMQGLTDEQIRDLNLGTSAKTSHCQNLPRLKSHGNEIVTSDFFMKGSSQITNSYYYLKAFQTLTSSSKNNARFCAAVYCIAGLFVLPMVLGVTTPVSLKVPKRENFSLAFFALS
jgi:hypothetical protein